jgi:CheY-like chemotaxis protein
MRGYIKKFIYMFLKSLLRLVKPRRANKYGHYLKNTSCGGQAGIRRGPSHQLDLCEEFEASEAATGVDALNLMKDQSFDLVLLDVGIPDHDGRKICRMARGQGVKTPIIMLTGVNTYSDTILGLDSGPIIVNYIKQGKKNSCLNAELFLTLSNWSKS